MENKRSLSKILMTALFAFVLMLSGIIVSSTKNTTNVYADTTVYTNVGTIDATYGGSWSVVYNTSLTIPNESIVTGLTTVNVHVTDHCIVYIVYPGLDPNYPVYITDFDDGASYPITNLDSSKYYKITFDTDLITIAETYSVVFNLNGGTSTTTIQNLYQSAGTAVTFPDKTTYGISRDGYIFLGWALTNNATSALSVYEVSAGDATSGTITLYAVWDDKNYNSDITIGISGLENNITVNDITITLSDSNLQINDSALFDASYNAVTTINSAGVYYLALVIEGKAGDYEFTNDGSWSYNGSTITITSGTLVVARGCSAIDLDDLDDIHFNAGSNKYLLVLCSCTLGNKVTYNANAGDDTVDNLPSESMYFENDVVTISTNTPTRTGYKFINWNSQQDGQGTSYSANGTFDMGNSNVTLYAQWVKILKNQPSHLNNYSAVVDDSLTSVATYQWYKQVNGGTAEAISGATTASFPSGITIEDATYYCAVSAYGVTATTTPFSSIKIVFDGNSGTGTAPSNQYRLDLNTNDNYNAVVMVANPFTKAGYKFVGWSTDSSAESGNTSNYSFIGS